MADGSHLIQYYRATGDELDANNTGQVLKGKAEYIYADGKIEFAEIGVKVLSRDKCEYFAVGRMVDGQPQADLLVSFVRKN